MSHLVQLRSPDLLLGIVMLIIQEHVNAAEAVQGMPDAERGGVSPILQGDGRLVRVRELGGGDADERAGEEVLPVGLDGLIGRGGVGPVLVKDVAAHVGEVGSGGGPFLVDLAGGRLRVCEPFGGVVFRGFGGVGVGFGVSDELETIAVFVAMGFCCHIGRAGK